MQKSVFLKVLPFIATMAVGVFVAGLFSSSEKVSLDAEDLKGHSCEMHERGLDCEHDHEEMNGRGGSRLSDRELKERIIELEQRLQAIECVDQENVTGKEKPRTSEQLPTSEVPIN
jgi:hypothetical protein